MPTVRCNTATKAGFLQQAEEQRGIGEAEAIKYNTDLSKAAEWAAAYKGKREAFQASGGK